MIGDIDILVSKKDILKAQNFIETKFQEQRSDEIEFLKNIFKKTSSKTYK